jgi:hypothetical protein
MESRDFFLHLIIRDDILNSGLTLIPYKIGSRCYTPEQHLEIVRDHIRADLLDVNEALAGKEY